MRKSTSYSENVTVINLYAQNSIALRVIKQTPRVSRGNRQKHQRRRLYFIAVNPSRSMSS